jgi:hypothetical protein
MTLRHDSSEPCFYYSTEKQKGGNYCCPGAELCRIRVDAGPVYDLAEPAHGDAVLCRKFRALILETKKPQMKIFRNTMNYPEILRKTD